MRILLYFIVILLATSCRPPKEATTSLVLKDNRGIIKMTLPADWDTTLQWTDDSDCKTCGRIMYRFQRQKFPVYMEKGWLLAKYPLDSIDQLTIAQTMEKQVTTDSLAAIRQFRENSRRAFLQDNAHTHFVIDTMMRVGAHLIAIVGVSNHYESTLRTDINALAILKRDGVMFNFRLVSTKPKKEDEYFVEKAMKVIRSIQLEE
jgi:hypothetical protein